MPQREVFLSHSSRDRKFASELAEVLRGHGIPVWYSKTHIRGARQWHDAFGRALARCTWFVIILSPGAVDSMWVKNELLFALNQRRYRDKIAPVLYKKCKYEKLSWTLSSFQKWTLQSRWRKAIASYCASGKLNLISKSQ